jgi:FixJ family two-component response regulator
MSMQPCVYVVDDDDAVRDGLGLVIEMAGFAYQAFESAEQFLAGYTPGQPGCLLLDINMPGLNGLELQEELSRRGIQLPIIFLTAYGDIPMTVRAMKAGAVDFMTKPVPSKLLIERIRDVLAQAKQLHEQYLAEQARYDCINKLTSRELELLPLIAAGLSNKEIARDLGISYRTMEVHRARILEKTGVTTLLELGHLCEACKLLPKSKPE